MIVYLDSSVLVRAYLTDEVGHAEAVALLSDPEIGLLTGTWTKIEVSSALVRAARTGQGDEQGLLALLDADLATDGRVTVIAAAQSEVEERALELVRSHGIRAMDAWHLATALLLAPGLAEPGEDVGFASRDKAQSEVAEVLGLRAV